MHPSRLIAPAAITAVTMFLRSDGLTSVNLLQLIEVGHVNLQPKSTFYERHSSFLHHHHHGRPTYSARGSATSTCTRKRPPAPVKCRFCTVTHMADPIICQAGRPHRLAPGNAHRQPWNAVFAPSPPWPTPSSIKQVGHINLPPETPTSTREMPFLHRHPHGRPIRFFAGS